MIISDTIPLPSLLLQHILLHSLNTNGVPTPTFLSNYLIDDINRYGTRLQETHARLTKVIAAKESSSSQPLPDSQIVGEDRFFNADGDLLENFSAGLAEIGEDMWGLGDFGL
jgi:hypothetical protein